MPARNITLYARWNITYTITFNSRGGSEVENIIAVANAELKKPKAPIREGYVFLGWFEEGAGEEFAFTVMPARDVVLYARWEESCVVTGLRFTLKETGTYEVTGYSGIDTEVVIPNEYKEIPVTSIGRGAFVDCKSIINIVFPESLEYICDYAFVRCYGLSNIVLPEGLETIGKYAFTYCENLVSINFPEGLKTIRDYAFYVCTNLEGVIFPESLTTIGNYAFAFCQNLTNIILPESLAFIGENAFHQSPYIFFYTKIPTKPEGWHDDWNPWNNPVYFGIDEVLEFNDMHYLVIDGSITITRYFGNDIIMELPASINGYQVTRIGVWAFKGCSIRKLILPEGLTTIEDKAFHSCGALRIVDFPDSLESIGAYAFNNCFKLSYIKLPDNVTVIGDNAFSGCWTSIFYTKQLSKPEGWSDNWNSDRPVYYGVAEIPLYNNLQYLLIDGSITITRYIGSESHLEVPSTIDGYQVRRIGISAFDSCESLKSVILSEGLEIIGDTAFRKCINLTEISLPESLKVIENYAFENDSSL